MIHVWGVLDVYEACPTDVDVYIGKNPYLMNYFEQLGLAMAMGYAGLRLQKFSAYGRLPSVRKSHRDNCDDQTFVCGKFHRKKITSTTIFSYHMAIHG